MSQAREVSPQAVINRLNRKVQFLESDALILEDDLLHARGQIEQLKHELEAAKNSPAKGAKG